jgi:hypothetical protein
MRWDLVHDGFPEWDFVRSLYEARRHLRALAKGDVVFLRTKKLLAFLRTTDRALETCLIVVNMEDTEVEETVSVRDGRIMAGTTFKDALDFERGDAMHFHVHMGFATLKMPAHSVRIFRVVPPTVGQHSPYKRMV